MPRSPGIANRPATSAITTQNGRSYNRAERTKSHVDQLTSPAGQPVTALRFEGDIASTSKVAVLGTYQALPRTASSSSCSISPRSTTSTPAASPSSSSSSLKPKEPARRSSPLASLRTSSKSSPWSASPNMQPSLPPRPKPSPNCRFHGNFLACHSVSPVVRSAADESNRLQPLRPTGRLAI